MTHKSDLIQIFSERGYIHQATDLEAIDKHAATSTIPTYIGFNCTADSLHVGSLVQIMMLRILQRCGHKPIVLMGGGTTKVGDPSGKDSARPLLSDQDIETNKNGIKKVFEKYLTFGDAPADALMVDNADWLDTLHYIRFLRDFGAHFSINRMMGMESVKLRLDREQNLSFLEFNYAILQAYDFLELRRRYGCMMQLGGSDQWGNIVSGIDLTRRVDSQEVFGLTSPLITTSSGAKMGKSANGAIWLNEERLSPFNFWQFWRNCDDADVEKFLLLFTEFPIEKIKALTTKKGHHLNEAKIVLANEVTKLCHGKVNADYAFKTSQAVFEENIGDSNLPTIEIKASDCPENISITQLMTISGIVKSGKEARRLIADNAVKARRKTNKTISQKKFEKNYFYTSSANINW